MASGTDAEWHSMLSPPSAAPRATHYHLHLHPHTLTHTQMRERKKDGGKAYDSEGIRQARHTTVKAYDSDDQTVMMRV